MRVIALCWLLFTACGTTHQIGPSPGAIGFDGDVSGWRAASTGGTGADATWTVQPDRSAISPPHVLSLTAVNHTSQDRFNLFWTNEPRFRDGRLSIAVRADDGLVDQGGGPVWRFQDPANYYVCRFNPLESNFRVYVVERGVRRQLGTAIVDVAVGRWHRIDVEHRGDRIVCWLDQRRLLDVTDPTIAVAGGVGVWTKADARTSFDDFLVQPDISR